MSQSISYLNGGFHVRMLVALMAIVFALIMGSAAGYFARAVTTPQVTITSPQVVAYPSPSPQRTILPNQV